MGNLGSLPSRLLRKARDAAVVITTYPFIRPYRDIEGWLPPQDAGILYRCARRVPAGGVIVEIGSWKGKSTYCLARGLRSGRVYAIDPFDASGDPQAAAAYKREKGSEPLLKQFQDKLSALGVLERVTTLVGTSQQHVGSVPDMDLLFIDGDHSIAGCLADFERFSPKVKRGGTIAFHDYDAAKKDLGPTWVVTNRLIPSPLFRFLGIYGTVALARRK